MRPGVVSDRERARSEAFAEGMREGEKRARHELAPALDALRRLAEHLRGVQEEILRGATRDLEGLALAVARHVVQLELTERPEIVRALVERALTLVPQDLALTLRIHPEDAAALAPDLERPAEGPAAVHWIADAAIERGSFVIETPQRVVDGRLDTALRTLFERFEHEGVA
jgi:flagellar biosynthesis/type III secretory pathway protein FliH